MSDVSVCTVNSRVLSAQQCRNRVGVRPVSNRAVFWVLYNPNMAPALKGGAGGCSLVGMVRAGAATVKDGPFPNTINMLYG